MNDVDARTAKQSGVEALRRSDWTSARTTFDQLVDAGHADALVWLGLAAACRGLNDYAAGALAVDRVLALEPRNVRALIMKGDHVITAGDIPGALSFYRAAMKSAATAGRLPQDLIGELRRAQSTCDRHAKEFEDYLLKQLRAQGFDEQGSSGRFVRSLDIMHGKRELFLQEPRHYYFPELPQVQFYDRASFPWLDGLEAATNDIRREAEAVLADTGAFEPYVTTGTRERPYSDAYGMRDNPDWSAFFLWRDGKPLPENAARCPRTLEALREAPLSRAQGRMPSILYSLLRPGAHIPPHTGVTNARLICHLPLIVPDGCMFRVGNDVRPWVEGKAWVFDDSINHEAWNQGLSPRVILLFDIWRPELDDEERRLIAALLEAVDAAGSHVTHWDA